MRLRIARNVRLWTREVRPTLALALPIMAGMVGQMLMGLADTIMVGRVGVVPLAAAAFVNAIAHLPFVFGLGLLSSISVLTSQAFGARRPDEAGEILRHGLLVASGLDVSKTLVPILSPKKVKQNLRTICIDPGHGGEDTGKRDGGRYEKTYTLLLAKELGRLLKSAGYRVVLTRTSDKSIELTDRPLVASRSKADLFVSLHFNGADVASAQGVEVYCMTPFGSSSTNAGGEGADSPTSPGNRFDERNVQLAFELQKLLVQRLEREDRGLRRARFAVLRDATMPAVLIEGGFMSNSAEARWIYSEPGRLKLAQSIVEALRNYKRNASL